MGDGRNPGSLVRISFASEAGDWMRGERVGRSGWRHENKTSYQSIVDKVRPRAISPIPHSQRPLGCVYQLDSTLNTVLEAMMQKIFEL